MARRDAATAVQEPEAPPSASTRRQTTVRRRRVSGDAEGQPLDPYTRFLYTPHTITCLVLALALLVYFSKPFSPSRSPADLTAAAEVGYANAKHGVWAVVSAYLVYSVIQGPSTTMIRPHPAFWRLVHGIIVCYLMLMVYLLFQTVDDARQFLKHFYPELGVDLAERAYGGDCSLTKPGGGVNWEVLRSTLFDEFVAAHIIGWWGKALMLRDQSLLWVISIAFELMELTFRHWLPNFNECWWDSWILDVALCNALGIWLGMKTVRFFQSLEYDWRGLSQQPSFWGKLRRSALQFTPASFSGFDWRPSSSPLRLLQCFFPALFFLFFELNCFFLKYVLWVPPTNPLNTYRLLILLGLGLPGMREWYEYMEGRAHAPHSVFQKLGSFCWLGIALALVEVLVSVKFGRGEFTAPWPRAVLLAWGTALSAGAAALAWWSWRYYCTQARPKPRGRGRPAKVE